MYDLIDILKEKDEWTHSPPPGHTFQISVLTWIGRDDGSADPWALARLAVPQLAELAEADRVTAEYWSRKHRGLFRSRQEELFHSLNWSDLMSRSDAELEKDGEFPHRIRFEQAGTVVLLEQTEFWNLAGGPMPYHDSVALSFFSSMDLQSKIEEIFLEACRSLGIKRRHTVTEPGAEASRPRHSD